MQSCTERLLCSQPIERQYFQKVSYCFLGNQITLCEHLSRCGGADVSNLAKLLQLILAMKK